MAARAPAGASERSELYAQAVAALEAGRPARAAEAAERAAQRADRARDRVGSAAARRVQALALLESGRMVEAQRAAEEAVAAAGAAGGAREGGTAELALGDVLSARGMYLEASAHLTRARELAAKARDTATLRVATTAAGLALARLGDGERGREAIQEILSGREPPDQPPAVARRVRFDAARVHAAAGRSGDALAALRDAERVAGVPDWPLALARARVLLDAGAYDRAREAVTAFAMPHDAPDARRAQRAAALASIALARGDAPDEVLALAGEDASFGAKDDLALLQLASVRAGALLAKGLRDEAEQIAVMVIGETSRRGTRDLAAASMALAAAAAQHPESALLRWLGALSLSQGGTAALVEHEALAALSWEPDPIGRLARTGLAVTRARLLDRAPPDLRRPLARKLTQVEQRAEALRDAHRAEAQIALDDAVLRAKDELGIAGAGLALVRAIATVARAARTNTSVVVAGETGSGKELFARLLHRLSPRAGGPFVAVNCAAIPEPLLEAELFGHERGAFTGAERARKGLFVEAEGGTLFLDEIGEMSAAMQAKLLRVLEDGQVRAVGGTRSRRVDVRVIAATHRDLAQMVAARTFREDLYYRIAAITVRVPPLRERREDVPAIARSLLQRDPETRDMRLDVPAINALSEYAWPGNVRELANVLRAAAAQSGSSVIFGEQIAQALETKRARLTPPAGGAQEPPRRETPREHTLAELRARQRAELRDLVTRAIAAADGNKLRAAHALGITRQRLYRLLEET